MRTFFENTLYSPNRMLRICCQMQI